MKSRLRTINQIVEEQVQLWLRLQPKEQKELERKKELLRLTNERLSLSKKTEDYSIPEGT